MPSSNDSGPSFDWAATALGALFTGGVYLDGWAHTHGLVDETFLTPWHAVLYSGYVALAALLVGRAAWTVRREGVPWHRAMPNGYGLCLVGVACWIVGGLFDAVWHTLFGFEVDTEALMSPAHALLALGFALMTSGPLRAALGRPPRRWWNELPMLFSLTFVVSILTFFTQIAHPIANLFGTRQAVMGVTVELGITGFLLTSVILTAPLLFLLRHGRLPHGGGTILVGFNAFVMGFIVYHGAYPRRVVAAIVAAACCLDVLRAALRPSPERRRAFRIFAVAVPTLPTAAYFLAAATSDGIVWSTHLWSGVIVFAAAAGWLVSSRVLPPPIRPSDRRSSWAARSAR
ncbi:MAG: hypothetical protein FJZ38_13605 [Candidatus Rokubacteria bacterium]|nr:hypothetical protein [Candidatus Rokubacteria bacterium]